MTQFKWSLMVLPSGFSRADHNDDDEKEENLRLAAIELTRLRIREQIGMNFLAYNRSFLGKDVCD
jgi:hypothetical protein